MSSLALANNSNSELVTKENHASDIFKKHSITIKGKDQPDKIPPGVAYKHALVARINLEELQERLIFGENDEPRIINISALVSDANKKFHQLNQKKLADITNRLCRALHKQELDGVKDSYAIGKLLNDADAEEDKFLEIYHKQLLAKLPKKQSNQMEEYVETVKRTLTHTYIDYTDVAASEPDFLYSLVKTGCDRFALSSTSN